MLNISDALNSHVEEALQGADEDVHYASNYAIVGNEAGQPLAIFMVVLSIPSLVAGERLTSGTVLYSTYPTKDQVTEAVRSHLQALLSERDQQNAQIMASTQQSDNGHGHPHINPQGAADLSSFLKDLPPR